MTDIASSSVVCRSRLCLWKYEYLIIFFTLIESGWWKNAHCRGSWWYAFAIYVFIFAASSCECNALHIRNKCETLCAVMRDGLAQECSQKPFFFKFFATSENIYYTYFDYTQSWFLLENEESSIHNFLAHTSYDKELQHFSIPCRYALSSHFPKKMKEDRSQRKKWSRQKSRTNVVVVVFSSSLSHAIIQFSMQSFLTTYASSC